MEWHERFVHQASWTRELREYLFEKAGSASAKRILEVGCGTGAVLGELRTSAAVHGLDLELERLTSSQIHAPGAYFTCGDAQALPYPSHIFDITFSHFLLLWVKDPVLALREMARVTRSGGYVLALAEPDYGNRIDRPEELAILGRWQAKSLQRQGANPNIGRTISKLFALTGITVIETGSLRMRGECSFTPEEQEMEWAVLESDLAENVPAEDIRRMRLLDEQAWARRERVLFVPTYFAFGVVTVPRSTSDR